MVGRRTSRPPPQLQLSDRAATVNATKGDPTVDVTAKRNIYLADDREFQHHRRSDELTDRRKTESFVEAAKREREI